MLIALADRLAESTVRRHLIFLAAALFTIAFIGYHFGTFDQVAHIPFLKKYVDPSLYPGDAFFDIRFEMYSYFWFFFQPFYRAGWLEVTMFAVHVAATYLTFWAVWFLSRTVFDDNLSALLAVAALMFPHVGFAGFPLIEFSLLNRTFVLPFLLFALALYLRGRYVLPLVLLGLVYNLHVISAQFVLAMMLFDAALRFRRLPLRRVAVALLAFLVCASPVLLWKLGGSPIDFQPRWDWFNVIARGTLYNIFYMVAPYPYILLATACGLGAFALYVVGRRDLPARPQHRTVYHFMVAVVIILLVELASAQWFPATILVQSQIIRAGLFALVFGYLYFADYLARAYRAARWPAWDWRLLAGGYIISTIPLVPVAMWTLRRLVRAVPLRQWANAALLVVTFATSLTVAWAYEFWKPGIYIYPHQTAWYATQLWARDNTPRAAIFLTPPHIWWFYEPEWRVFSERSAVVSLSELLVGAFVPSYLNLWQPRFEQVAPGALDRFEGDFFKNKEITAEAFYSLSPADLLQAARDYGADYIVVEKPHAYPWPVAYENEGFVVYRVAAEAGR